MTKIQSLLVSPWNIAVGVWLGAARRRRGASTERMAESFGEAVRPAYLRTVEAGQNALPANAVKGLVEGYALSFANAAMLTASVRILDVRQRNEKGFDLDRLAKAATSVAALWPQSGAMMDWLIEQVHIAGSSNRDIVRNLRNDAKKALPLLEQMLLAPDAGQQAQKSDIAVQRPDVNPFFEDALDALLKRLALMPPELTQDQVKQWERDTASRWTGVWGVVSDGEALIRLFADYDWSFLLNLGHPPLRIFVNAERNVARSMQEQLIDRATKRLLRSNEQRSTLNIEVHPWGTKTARIGELLLFDHATRRAAPALPAGKAIPASFTSFMNAWLYEVAQTPEDGAGRRRLGFLDSFNLEDPRYYCAALGREDLRLWFDTLEQIHG